MGAIALSSPYTSLTDALLVEQQGLTGIGSALVKYKYTGSLIDFTLGAVGDPQAGSGAAFTSIPTDAVALEVWGNSNGGSDYLFWSSRAGQLSAVGNLATNTANNTGATNPNRFVTSGNHVIIPNQSVGVQAAALRFAGGGSAIRCQGRWIAAGSGFPYLLAASGGVSTEFVLVGAGASQQVPFNTASIFPTGYCGFYMQITGTGPVRMTFDGTTPTATLGDILLPGMYLVDVAKMGIALSALRMYIPASTWVIGNALNYA